MFAVNCQMVMSNRVTNHLKSQPHAHTHPHACINLIKDVLGPCAALEKEREGRLTVLISSRLPLVSYVDMSRGKITTKQRCMILGAELKVLSPLWHICWKGLSSELLLQKKIENGHELSQSKLLCFILLSASLLQSNRTPTTPSAWNLVPEWSMLVERRSNCRSGTPLGKSVSGTACNILLLRVWQKELQG